MSVHRITLIRDLGPERLGIRSIVINVDAPNEAQAKQDALVRVTSVLGTGFRERKELPCYRCGGCGRDGGGGDMTCPNCWGSGKLLEDI